MQTTPATPLHTTNDSARDLAAVIPSANIKNFAGVDIAIRQIKIGALPDVLLAIQPLAHMLTQADKLNIPSMFMLYAEDCLNLTVVLSGQPRSWVNDLELDEGIQLFTDLLEVNADFFIQKVLPQLVGALQRITHKVQLANPLTATTGPTASSS